MVVHFDRLKRYVQSQKRKEVVQHRLSTPECDDEIISDGVEEPDQWQNNPVEDITVEFKDDTIQDNVVPEQL